MLVTLILSGLLASTNPHVPASLEGTETQSIGMSHFFHGPASEADAQRVCLIERASGRKFCRRMDAWRALARRLEHGEVPSRNR
jgi:hypothetical protein